MLDYSVKVFLLHVFRVIFKDGILGDVHCNSTTVLFDGCTIWNDQVAITAYFRWITVIYIQFYIPIIDDHQSTHTYYIYLYNTVHQIVLSHCISACSNLFHYVVKNMLNLILYKPYLNVLFQKLCSDILFYTYLYQCLPVEIVVQGWYLQGCEAPSVPLPTALSLGASPCIVATTCSFQQS